MAQKKVLISLTSFNGPFYADGKNTGVFVVEALHPFNTYIEKGYEVQFVSETGTYGWDEHSLEPEFLSGNDLKDFEDKNSAFNVALSKIKTPKDLLDDIKDYSIFFASAGHGCLFDYPTASGLHMLASSLYTQGGVVAAVCHGPVIFEGINDTKTGRYIIEGKSVTGFTDLGETILQVDGIMKEKSLESPETVLWKLGAKFLAPIGPWDDFSITDGRVVTGVNPASAVSTAIRSINALPDKA
ncbi:hypothetical protein TBLA_0H02460 [Henningerozyma blattae CBS 6284]|uniref:D-lactate dehydratase n=1 Tax=Henningerozyma blattae (strain ATCC 34711 / CBS 6284 / DSM 70876 / NBRC 10599 / NRRL Y-10934 / UCD 77-7) TaxID=1071380 RepID=I2H828_HENB6|nr:hypothetical protein TBLA_0H02460 [Tetrapisispora blattae CBS 6284]CCH62530.1 hypothetical protein TBLA_0H02460 [Tetrapisispora blattae CBS 6284]